MTDKKQTSQVKASSIRPPVFVSLRWRFMSPLFFVVLITAMVGAFVLANSLADGVAETQENILLQSSHAIAERANSLYERNLREAQRVAFTVDVPEAVRDNDGARIESSLRGFARVGDFDSVIVMDANGREVIGVQQVDIGDETQYQFSRDTDLGEQAMLSAILAQTTNQASGIMRTPLGFQLYTATPIVLDGAQIGVVMVGQRLTRVLDELQGSAHADLVLYGADSQLLSTTFDDSVSREALTIPTENFAQALNASNQIPIVELDINGDLHQGAYQPLNYGTVTLGVVGAVRTDDVSFATEFGRQLTALFASVLAGGVVIVGFMSISAVTERANKVSSVAVALAEGEASVRTGMQAVDEISAIGQALDDFADSAQERQDKLLHRLRRQRREHKHTLAVLESLPNGVIVQDLKGRVMMMNDLARELLGSQRVYRSSGLYELADAVGQTLGAVIAPGLYALGDPRQVGLDGRMVSAQAAAIYTQNDKQLGTVILLRDITDEVQKAQNREAVLARLSEEIQQPLTNLARSGMAVQSDMVRSFAREITRHAVALQRMILDMHEMEHVDTPLMERSQRPIRLDTLIWSVANEWRQVARANQLTLHVLIQDKDVFVLGDEKRLRWAIGNVVDNAIKFTPAGGALTLEIRESIGNLANLRIRDNGVGIRAEERPHVFTRFYRGTPTTKAGDILAVAGMGQGLYIAQQITHAHGGKIGIKSTQGVGTAVYFGLPMTAPVSLDIPEDMADMDGDTVRLPVDFLQELDG